MRRAFRVVPGVGLLSLLALLTSAALPAAPRPATGTDDSSRVGGRSAPLQEILRGSLTAPRVRLDETGRVIALAGRFRVARENPRAAAERFLRDHADRLGLREDLADLLPPDVVTDLGGAVVRFGQHREGIPVRGGAVIVGFDPSGALIHIRNRYIPTSASTAPSISPAEARQRADRIPGGTVRAEPRLLIVPGDKEHPGRHLAWEVTVERDSPPGAWAVDVEAGSGEVVAIGELLRRAAPACVVCNAAADPACGRIFFESPVVRLDDPSVRDNDNIDAAHVDCAVENLVSAAMLDGLYASTALSGPRYAPPWDRTRSSSGGQQDVDELNAYYHADRGKRYLTQIGFPGVMSFPIAIDAHDSSLGDNSLYRLTTKSMHFGTGGVDDAQDPEIVYHEYGHAIQDNQVPGFGTGGESGAMGEGFGDYWAAAMLDQTAATLLGRGCVGPWDATSYNPWTGTYGTGCLRRIDRPWLYPRDLRFEVHNDGEIWSAFLWDLHGSTGGAVADPLIIKAHTFLAADADFIDGVDAILSADAVLDGSAHVSAIETVRIARGLPRSAAPAADTGLTLSDPFACATAHNYASRVYVECRHTVPGAARLRLHFTRFDTEAGWDFAWISDGSYNTVQVISGNLFAGGAGTSATVAGDTIVLRFKADPSIQRWGFDIDEVEYAPAPPQGPGQVPNGGSVAGAPLVVERDAGGDLTLTWGATCGAATDYAVYEGSLGEFGSHVARACSTGGATTFTLTPSSGSSYYLIVPVSDVSEGSYGQRSDGTERPPSPLACLVQQVTGGC